MEKGKSNNKSKNGNNDSRNRSGNRSSDDSGDKGNARKNKVDREVLGLIWGLLSPHRLRLFLSVVVLLFSKGLIVFVPVGIKFGIDLLKDLPIRLSVMGYTLIDLSGITLGGIAYILFFLLVLQYGASYLQIYLTNGLGLNMMSALREKLFSHTIEQSFSFYNRTRIGLLLTRIVHDIQTLNELFVTGIPTIFGDLFLIVSIVILSFFIDVKLTLVSLFTLPFLFLGMLIFKRYSRRSFLEIRTKLSRLNVFLQSALGGIGLVQIFNKENKVFRVFSRLQKDYFMEYLRTVKIYSYYFPVVESFSVLSRVFIILFGSYWIYVGESSLSSVVAFLFFSPMFFHPLRELSEQYNVLQSAMASGEKIFDLFSTRDFIEDGTVSLSGDDGIRGHIEFCGVSFSYNEGKRVLDDVSFELLPGEKLALVGLTGSGKTTIINLLSRLYDNYTGEILIDGVSIRDYRKADLRRSISYMLQDVFIFSDTIKENIRLFDDGISDEDVYDIASKVQADKFISRLEGSYDTELGERGLGISFGERQLISFARALVQGSSIVIFDEATSNIDIQTESIIQSDISKFLRDKTAIVIAHRLSTIREMDKIIFLHKGRIRESGTHEELLALGGYYKKLYMLQFDDSKLGSIS